LGLGDFDDRNFPVEMTIKKIYLGCHISFIYAENKWYCFGNHSFGELGLGDTENRCLPVEFEIKNEITIT